MQCYEVGLDDRMQPRFAMEVRSGEQWAKFLSQPAPDLRNAYISRVTVDFGQLPSGAIEMVEFHDCIVTIHAAEVFMRDVIFRNCTLNVRVEAGLVNRVVFDSCTFRTLSVQGTIRKSAFVNCVLEEPASLPAAGFEWT